MNTFWKVITRKKVLDEAAAESSQLSRVLTTWDLTFLGVGSTLGVGVYVLAGHVAKDVAGPAVVLSFLIAAIASVFAGLCYSEFGARVPRAGSAYIYSYVCVGELVAFVIGWNLILEYVIGSASVARGLSLYLDSLLNNTMKNAFIDVAPINNISFMSSYFDFFAFGISTILSIALAFGMKESSLANNIFTILNICVVLFVIIAGSIKADPKNWDLHVNSTNSNENVGSGGFFPFGVEGMIKGAATCFYGFVGFDCIATTGEEVKNPRRAIPISIILSLSIIFLAYFGTSVVVTLMLPYYEQDPDAPIPHAFEVVGWDFAKWIVAIGGIFGLCASLFGAMFPLPRVIYAMASDSLVFQFLGKISERFQTPVIGTLLAGLLTGLMAALFDLSQLVKMMSIGTLLAYTIVAASVLLLRYSRDDVRRHVSVQSDSDDSEGYTDDRMLINGNDEIERNVQPCTSGNVLKQIFNCGRLNAPSNVSETVVATEIFIYCIFCIFIGLCALYLKDPLADGEIWAIVLTSIVVAVAVILIISLAVQPMSNKELTFKVPFVPVIPAISILMNIYLMLMLDFHTWIRFAIWMLIGLPIYYFSIIHRPDARNKSLADISAKHHSTNLNPNVNNGYVNSGFSKENNNVAYFLPQENGVNNNIDSNLKQNDNKFSRQISDDPYKVLKELDERLEQEDPKIASKPVLSIHSMSSVSVNDNEEFYSPGPTPTLSTFSPMVTTKLNDGNNIYTNLKENKDKINLDETKGNKFYYPPNVKPIPPPIVPPHFVESKISNEFEKKEQIPNSSEKAPPVPPLTSSTIQKFLGSNDQIASSTKSDISPTSNEENMSAQINGNNNFLPPPPPPLPPPMTIVPLTSHENKQNAGAIVRPSVSQLTSVVLKPNVETLPPPPPFPTNDTPPNKVPLYVKNSATILRPSSDQLKTVVLKPTKKQDTVSSETNKDKEAPPPDDHLKFGSTLHRKFIEKLSNVYSALPLPQYFQPKPKPADEVKTQAAVNPDDVISNNIDIELAKENLTKHLQKTQQSDEKNFGENPNEDGRKSETNLDNDKVNHEDKMQNVFNNIKLRRVESSRNNN